MRLTEEQKQEIVDDVKMSTPLDCKQRLTEALQYVASKHGVSVLLVAHLVLVDYEAELERGG